MIVDTPTSSVAKCDSCGRFYRYGEPGSSWCFVPSSDAPSYEELVDWCRTCTEQYGKPIPRQRVNIEMCCGIIQTTPPEAPNE